MIWLQWILADAWLSCRIQRKNEIFERKPKQFRSVWFIRTQFRFMNFFSEFLFFVASSRAISRRPLRFVCKTNSSHQNWTNAKRAPARFVHIFSVVFIHRLILIYAIIILHFGFMFLLLLCVRIADSSPYQNLFTKVFLQLYCGGRASMRCASLIFYYLFWYERTCAFVFGIQYAHRRYTLFVQVMFDHIAADTHRGFDRTSFALNKFIKRKKKKTSSTSSQTYT